MSTFEIFESQIVCFWVVVGIALTWLDGPVAWTL